MEKKNIIIILCTVIVVIVLLFSLFLYGRSGTSKPIVRTPFNSTRTNTDFAPYSPQQANGSHWCVAGETMTEVTNINSASLIPMKRIVYNEKEYCVTRSLQGEIYWINQDYTIIYTANATNFTQITEYIPSN